MATSTLLPPNVRPIDIRRDLTAIADLIELCFKDHLDADGRSYLDQMRRAAHNARYLTWAMSSKLQMPVSGYVWEDAGRISGNVSLIPVNKDGYRTYMIANVAVHPDFRRLGIGRALTEKAMRFCEQQGARSVWLQVRDDNPGAEHIYAELGFVERVRRSTWIIEPMKQQVKENSPSPYRVTYRKRGDYEWQTGCLDAIYPANVRWNLPLHTDTLKPGFRHALWRFLNEYNVQHWVARRGREPKGIVTWTPSHLSEDYLWLAVPPEEEEEIILYLLPAVLRSLHSLRPLTLNYPAGRGESAFPLAGFSKQNTLIWMEKIFASSEEAAGGISD